MSESLIALLQQALLLALWISVPMLGATALAGVVTGMVGAITQVQDAAVGLALRVVAVVLVLVALGPFMIRRMLAFGNEVMGLLHRLGGG